MIKRLVALVFFVFCMFVAGVSAQPIHAQTVGSHLGVGDVGGQINNIQVLRANGAGAGFPVTALLNVNTAGNGEQSMVDLQRAISDAGFYPIIRLTHVCDPALNAGFVQNAISNINSTFGDVTIVYGNEVNNREVECSDWQRYLTEYSWVAGMPNVVPSALDYYNGVYLATDFLATGNASAIYNGGGPFVANAYGCVGVTEPNCDPATTDTHAQGYSRYAGKQYDLTEFSLSPEGRSAVAPDTNLQLVIDFIEGRAGSTGARYITPLVRNVCNDEGEWLLYVNGRLFTMNSTEVTENCEGSSGDGYNLDGYPFYDIDHSRFYITPIKSLGLNVDAAAKAAAIRSELAQSGYETYCVGDQVTVSPEYNSSALIDRFVELQRQGVVAPLLGAEVESVALLDFTNASTPVWRDVNDRRFLMTSLEEYFSFKDVYDVPGSTGSTNEVTTAAINSLLTTHQRCVQSVKTVVATQIMCEKLENLGPDCALRSREIPGTNYTMQTLIEAMESYVGTAGVHFRGGGEVGYCNSIIYGESTPQELKDGILNVNLHMDRAYRLAFLVARISSRSPVSGRPTANIFNFFTTATYYGSPRDEVLIIAFKVPDFATNRGGGDASGSYYWEDAAYLTRNSLITKERIAEINDELRAERRTNIEANANSAGNRNQSEGDEIFCIDGTFPGGTRGDACKEPLGKAVVDIINGNTPSCAEDVEPASQITDAGGLEPIPPEANSGKVFLPEHGGDVLMNLFFGDGTHLDNGVYNPQLARTDDDPAGYEPFRTIWDITPETWPPFHGNTEVEFYLTYPSGFEQEYIEQVLAGTFFTQAELAELEQDPELKDRFEVLGGTMGVDGGSIGHTFNDPANCVVQNPQQTIDPITGEPIPATGPPVLVCTPSTFTISIDNDPIESVKVIGARIGFWARTAQLKLNSYFTNSHAYLLSCTTTEQFLLGACAGGVTPSIPDPINNQIQAVAQCNGGPRITSGEGAQHIYSTTFPDCTIYDASVHGIPNWQNQSDPFTSCSELYEFVACTFPNSLIQNPVTADGQFSESGTQTACEYVVNRAIAAGISPRFALTIWGEESGFSHYRVPDFGVISQPAQDLGAQMDGFIGIVEDFTPSQYQTFLERYSGEAQGSNLFCNNPAFPARVAEFYEYLGP